MRNIFYISGFILLAVGLKAQDSLAKKRWIKFYSLNLKGELCLYDDRDVLKVNEYRELAKTNSLAGLSPETFKNGYTNGSMQTFGVTLYGGFIFYNKNKHLYNNRYELKFGCSYQMAEEQSIAYNKTERTRFDTLKANHSNDMYFVDTVKYQNLNYYYNKQYITLNVEFAANTFQNRILSLYSGIGTGAGATLENEIRISHIQSVQFIDQNNKYYNYAKASDSDFHKNETTKLAPAHLFLAYIPVGGRLRFSNTKKGFVSRIALNFEFKFGGKYEAFANKKIFSSYLNISFGLKYFLNREPIMKSYRPPNPFY